MKKTLAVILSLMMILCGASALAETTPAEYTVDAPDGSTYGYEQFNFMMTMPAGFEQSEVSDTDREQGALDTMTNGTNAIQLRVTEAPEGFDFNANYETLKTTEGVVSSEFATINGITWVCYLTADNQVIGLTMVGENVLLYVIGMPADTEGFAEAFQKTLGSIASYAPAAE